ncbi:MAG: hydrogenase maturation protease [Coriobacteriales bacterium]|nr:hydrogenase maturation protease [Coriobacteriales bacterium]
MKNLKETLVVCVGNILLKDEGFGPYIARVLCDFDEARKYFDDADARELVSHFYEYEVGNTQDANGRIPVLDAATMGMSMIPLIRDFDNLLVVDIIDTKSDKIHSGDVLVLEPDDIADNAVKHSLHDMKVIDVLAQAQLAGHDANIKCICVQAKDYQPVDFDMQISQELLDAIPNCVGAIMELL